MEPQGPVRPGIPPSPPAHIIISSRSLPYSPPGGLPPPPPQASHGNPPSYVNPGQGSIQQQQQKESATSFIQQTWPQGAGAAADLGVTIEPEPLTTVDDTTKGKKDEEDTSSVSSDTPSVQHFNISFVYEKTFREHKGANASDCIQGKLDWLYTKTLKVTYNIFVCLFGFCLAFLWAIINGAVSFAQSWCVSPLLRVSLVLVKGILPIILEPLSLILKAVMDGCRGGNIGGMIGGAMSAMTGK